MKRITFSYDDQEFNAGLAALIMGEGARPVVFEVEDDYDLNGYEGLKEYAPAPEKPAEVFNTKFPEVAAWLEGYRGNFEFYVSLKQQYAARGMLSEKQIAAVQRAIERDRAAGVSVISGQKREFDLKPGTVVVLSKSISTKIAKQAGHARAHRAFEVVEVEAESAKAYRAKVRLSARRTSYCGVCGLMLENPQSLAAGIGPICADNNGISYGDRSLDELNALLDTTVEVVTWLPKKSIKEKLEPKAEVAS